MFCKKVVLKNFPNFTRKHLCQSLFFNEVAVLASNYIKKETLAQVFSCEFWAIFKNTYFYRTPLVAASELRHEYDIKHFWTPMMEHVANFFYLLYLESSLLSVAYFTVANLARLGMSVRC